VRKIAPYVTAFDMTRGLSEGTLAFAEPLSGSVCNVDCPLRLILSPLSQRFTDIARMTYHSSIFFIGGY
jgi:hypothetical protein